jgi:mono/diheme cytochrome c family protein
MAHGSQSSSEKNSRRKFHAPPFWLIAVGLVLVVASWLPLVIAARARFQTSPNTRIHLIQDMDQQPKYKTQTSSKVFADGRAMRLPPVGTVAVGHLQDDDHFYRGFSRVEGANGESEVKFFTSLPAQVPWSSATLKRGQEKFNIYCLPCHGALGDGKGPIVLDAEKIGSAWVARNIHEQAVIDQTDGQLFNTVSNGVRSMPGYASQIAPADRWAIVAYVRALQLSENPPAELVNSESVPASLPATTQPVSQAR